MKKFSFTKCGSSRYFLRVLWQFLRTRRSRSNFGGLAVAAAGGEMRSNYFKNTALVLMPKIMKGELLILLAQVSWAVSTLFMKKFVQNTNPFLATSLIVLIGAILISPIFIYFSKEIKSFSYQKMALAILIAILWIPIGEILYNFGLSKISLSKASLLALTFPFFCDLTWDNFSWRKN